MASGDDLKSFKIRDQSKAPVERPRPGKASDAPSTATSVGFPAIEALVESDAPDLEGMRARLASLRELSEQGKSQKEKAAAKKAAVAYEKVGDLLEFLFSTKATLASAPK